MHVTSYNPEPGQTDSTPCVAGGTGYSLCDRAQQGERLIALSQELLAWSTQRGPVQAGDQVTLESIDQPNDPRCNGTFTVADAMNVRFTNKADLFLMNRSDNTSCYARVLHHQ